MRTPYGGWIGCAYHRGLIEWLLRGAERGLNRGLRVGVLSVKASEWGLRE